jgi:hypothetical protein
VPATHSTRFERAIAVWWLRSEYLSFAFFSWLESVPGSRIEVQIVPPSQDYSGQTDSAVDSILAACLCLRAEWRRGVYHFDLVISLFYFIYLFYLFISFFIYFI